MDARGHVLDTDGRPITGLYAAGELTGIIYKEYPAGTSGLRSMTLGRLTGLQSALDSVREAAAV